MMKRNFKALRILSILLFCLTCLFCSGQANQFVVEGWALVSPVHYGKEAGQKKISFGETGDHSIRIIINKTRNNSYTSSIELITPKKQQVFDTYKHATSPDDPSYIQDVYIYQLGRTFLLKVLIGTDQDEDEPYGSYTFVYQDNIWKRLFLIGDVYHSKNGSYLYYAQYDLYGDLNLERRYFGLLMKESSMGLNLQPLEIPLYSGHKKRILSPREYAWRYDKGLRMKKGDRNLYCKLFGERQLQYFKDALNIERAPDIASRYKESIPYIKSEATKNIDLIIKSCGK